MNLQLPTMKVNKKRTFTALICYLQLIVFGRSTSRNEQLSLLLKYFKVRVARDRVIAVSDL